jgi:small nuclear ribonucleoprotein (snRNP)-like protein
VIIGKFMAFDKLMNLIIGDAEEFRKVISKAKKEER